MGRGGAALSRKRGRGERWEGVLRSEGAERSCGCRPAGGARCHAWAERGDRASAPRCHVGLPVGAATEWAGRRGGRGQRKAARRRSAEGAREAAWAWPGAGGPSDNRKGCGHTRGVAEPSADRPPFCRHPQAERSPLPEPGPLPSPPRAAPRPSSPHLPPGM